MGLFGKVFGGDAPVPIDGRIAFVSQPKETCWSLETCFFASPPRGAPPASLEGVSPLVQAANVGTLLPIQNPGHIFRVELAPGHWQAAVVAIPFVGRSADPTGAGLQPARELQQVCFPLPSAFEVRAGQARSLSLKITLREVPRPPEVDARPLFERLDPYDRDRLEHSNRIAATDPAAALQLLGPMLANPRSDPSRREEWRMMVETQRMMCLLALGRAREAVEISASFGKLDAILLAGRDRRALRDFFIVGARAWGHLAQWEAMTVHASLSIRVLDPLYALEGPDGQIAHGLAVQGFTWCVQILVIADAWTALEQFAEVGRTLSNETNVFGLVWLAHGAAAEARLATGRGEQAEGIAAMFLQASRDRGWGRAMLLDLIPPLLRARLDRAAAFFEERFRNAPE